MSLRLLVAQTVRPTCEAEPVVQFMVPHVANEPGGDWRLLAGQLLPLGRGGMQAYGVRGMVMQQGEQSCNLYLRGTQSTHIEDLTEGEWIPLMFPTLGNGRIQASSTVEAAIEVGVVYRLVDDRGQDVVFTVEERFAVSGD